MGQEFTGERFLPSLRGQIYYEHVHRYAIAEPLCVGKRVLDLACGEGYGSAFLARRAASVVGVDVDEATIVQARRTYYQENLQFVVASADNLPLLDGSVDTITCFETIEHLEDHEAMLDEFRRVLAPGGVLFISSPNKLVYTDKHGANNPYHVHELYFEEFRELLLRHFPNVRIYGQRLIESSVMHPLGAARERSAGWISGNGELAEGGLVALKDPVYFMAVCSYGPLPGAIAGAFVDPNDDLAEPHGPDLSAKPEVRATGVPRILVACAPKSGSTFVTNVLSRYFGARVASSELREMQWEAEQNLNRGMLTQIEDGAFVLQLHMKPYDLNFALMREFGVSLLLQWRNLADMIVSLDEHLAEFGVEQPLCYIHDGPGFLGLPAHQRYDYLIRNALDWYVWFYLAWRKQDATFGVYERMLADPASYFEGAIERLGGVPERARIDEILTNPSGFTRFNVGIVGRSAELFSLENRRALEDALLGHLWSTELEVLLWELPWAVPALEARDPLDGTVVRMASRASELYFVSRGVRHRLSLPESWLGSRATIGPESVRTIPARQLKAIPEGDPIS
jgi:ubiquinone/menaquinone biosynthesis C-methylase UbiE